MEILNGNKTALVKNGSILWAGSAAGPILF